MGRRLFTNQGIQQRGKNKPPGIPANIRTDEENRGIPDGDGTA